MPSHHHKPTNSPHWSLAALQRTFCFLIYKEKKQYQEKSPLFTASEKEVRKYAYHTTVVYSVSQLKHISQNQDASSSEVLQW